MKIVKVILYTCTSLDLLCFMTLTYLFGLNHSSHFIVILIQYRNIKSCNKYLNIIYKTKVDTKKDSPLINTIPERKKVYLIFLLIQFI